MEQPLQPLEQVQNNPEKKKWYKAWWLMAIGVLLVLGGAFYYVRGTPRYSLYQTRKAVLNHDSTSFNKYVDVDRITSGLLDTASQGFDDEMKKQDNPFGGLGQGILQAMMPALKERMKSSINTSIEKISDGNQNTVAGGKVSIKEIKQEGKSANVTILNDKNEEIHLNMVQTPDRYWRIVGVNLDDFKKISPDALNIGDTSPQDETTNEIVIDKAIGDEVELATMKFKVNSVEEKQSLKGSFGATTTADENTKFVVINMTATNITNESYDFDEDDFKLIDDKERKFDAYSVIGNVDNYLDMRSLQPSIPEKGVMVYKIPNDATSYGIQVGKKNTNEVYRVNLK